MHAILSKKYQNMSLKQSNMKEIGYKMRQICIIHLKCTT